MSEKEKGSQSVRVCARLWWMVIAWMNEQKERKEVVEGMRMTEREKKEGRREKGEEGRSEKALLLLLLSRKG